MRIPAHLRAETSHLEALGWRLEAAYVGGGVWVAIGRLGALERRIEGYGLANALGALFASLDGRI